MKMVKANANTTTSSHVIRTIDPVAEIRNPGWASNATATVE